MKFVRATENLSKDSLWHEFDELCYTHGLRMKKRIKLPDAALEFFQKTGREGGLQRAANMTQKERSEQARRAVQARWAKQKREKESEK